MICFKPNDIWMEFLSTFTKYDIYVIIDDNQTDYKEQYAKYTNIHIIQIANEDCIQNGFLDTDFKKNGFGWSKALYYFSSIQTNYNYVWFVEYDVFIHSQMTLLKIDSQYKHADLLTNKSKQRKNVKGDWNWDWIKIDIPLPHFHAMCCAVRMSPAVLSKIKEYANTHKRLFFHEALSPTICHHNKLIHSSPKELRNIVYRKNYKDKDIDTKNLYHPVKDIEKHTHYRRL